MKVICKNKAEKEDNFDELKIIKFSVISVSYF